MTQVTGSGTVTSISVSPDGSNYTNLFASLTVLSGSTLPSIILPANWYIDFTLGGGATIANSVVLF